MAFVFGYVGGVAWPFLVGAGLLCSDRRPSLRNGVKYDSYLIASKRDFVSNVKKFEAITGL